MAIVKKGVIKRKCCVNFSLSFIPLSFFCVSLYKPDYLGTTESSAGVRA